MAPHTSKVVIVGAGAAGIAAAARLLENGLNDVVILEAENRIGGRIHSVEFDGSVVDLGAQWCHGEKDNIVYDLAKDVLKSSTYSYRDFNFYMSDGTVVEKSVGDTLMGLAFELFEDEELARDAKGTFGEYFIKQYRKKVDCLDPGIKETSELLLDLIHKFWMGLEAAHSWFEVSGTGPFRYKLCEGDLYLNWGNKGYRTILDILMKQSPIEDKIHFNKEVNKVVWGSGNVTIFCTDGSSYNCDQVIITVSLGVLKKMLRSFVPALPPVKQNAIEAMSIGDVHKIFLKFPTKWWPDDVKGFSLVWKEGDRRNLVEEFPRGVCRNGKSWLEDVFGFYVIDNHPNVLLGWVVGENVEEIEQLSDQVVMDGCIFLLRKFLGKIYRIDPPNKILRSVWRNNPHFVGSYSYLSLEAERRKASFEDLAMPVNVSNKPVLLFAGEATHSCYYSTVHGAIETGFREANRILNTSVWRNNPHFVGSYSYLSLEAERRKASFEDLAMPVNVSNKPVLLFAGEATHSCYYSTVHGAIETGFREANRILNTSSKLIHRKVAIVGAGMAGLGAATTLHKLGCRDFVLIEAQNRPGGRIHTLTFDNNILELGAQWIHGKENPLYELAREHDLLSEITSEEGLGLYIRDNGEIIDEDIVKRVDFEVGRILSDCEQFVGRVDHPKSVGEYMEDRFMEYLNTCQDPDNIKEIKLELFDWHVRFQIVDNSCLNLNELSAKAWGHYVCVDDVAHINLKCGFNELVKVLVNQLPKNSILLSTPVAEIRRANDHLKINKIICDNGVVVTSDYLIITPSLGVLKRMKITPDLPYEISQSIQELGFRPIGKIFLVFEYKWWDVDGFQFIWRRNTTNENTWVRHITGFDPVIHAPTVLLGWVGSEGVKVMESLCEEDVGNDCMNLFRKFIRDKIIPNPVRVVRTSWLSNPWVLGGYSHVTPNCDRSGLGMHKLSQPIFVDGKPRILIAGEAANPSHFSTIHGAYESGQEQAKLLAEYIMKNSKL